jgi:uncharacterized protein
MPSKTRQRELPADLTIERRSLTPAELPQIRAADQTADPIGFKGHAAVFNKRTWIGPPTWGFAEQVAPGAFAKTIGEHDIRMLIDHDPSRLLARNTPGTLRLAEDKIGLDVDADMAPTSYARDAAILLDRGDLSGMSFGFQTVTDKWEEVEGAEGNKFELRTLLEVKLFDVSIVTFPAYPDTDAGLRDLGIALLTRDLDDGLREQLIGELRSGGPGLLATVRTAREQLGEQRARTVEAITEVVTEAATAGDAATAVPDQGRVEADESLLVTLQRHLAGEHRGAPRALCTACAYDLAAAVPAAA